MSSATEKTEKPSNSDRPYGTEPRRPMYPLLLWIVLFVGWFAFLIVLALREAALR